MSKKWNCFIRIGILIVVMSLLGCKEKKQDELDYSSCNRTSKGSMAEVEDGYFFVKNGILFYADKENLEQWVPVCNKPNCVHIDYNCNGYVSSYDTIWQKDGRLYGILSLRDTTFGKPGTALNRPYIYEILLDGSGYQVVYEIPIGKEIQINSSMKALFQDAFLYKYGYLDEYGEMKEEILLLNEDENGEVMITSLYQGTGKQFLMSAGLQWSTRGENLIITSPFYDENNLALKNLCKIEDGEIVPLNLPADIDVYGGYFKDDIFTYYKKGEGFYQYDISTGTEELFLENQLEDGQGYILSDEYIVECNCYVDYMPEEAYLKIYTNEEWVDIKLPKEVINSEDPFYPLCIASDRLFFRKTVTKNGKSTAYLYYVMFEEMNGELIYAGKIGIGNEEESSLPEETSQADSTIDFKEVIVFDTEEYLFKITDVYLNKKNYFCVDMFFENRSEDKEYNISGNYWTINGMQCDTAWGSAGLLAPHETKTYTLCFGDSIIGPTRIPEFYQSNEYTNIEAAFVVRSGEMSQYIEDEATVSFYPQGEEAITTFTRESQDTDQILVDKEEVSVTVTGYGESLVPGDTIYVLIENKTEQYLHVKVEEAAANGISIEPMSPYFGLYNVRISPGAIALYPMTLFDGISPDAPFAPDPSSEFFDTNEITSIEEVKMRLTIFTSSLKNGDEEQLLDEIYVLNP